MFNGPAVDPSAQPFSGGWCLTVWLGHSYFQHTNLVLPETKVWRLFSFALISRYLSKFHRSWGIYFPTFNINFAVSEKAADITPYLCHTDFVLHRIEDILNGDIWVVFDDKIDLRPSAILSVNVITDYFEATFVHSCIKRWHIDSKFEK